MSNSDLFVPPYVEAPEQVRLSPGLLKAAISNTISTWPKSLYETGFYKPPGTRVLLTCDEGAIEQMLLREADRFPQSTLTLRILAPVWRGGLAAQSGHAWRWQRRAMAPAFTPAAVEPVIGPAVRSARKLAARMQQDGEPVDVFAAAADAVTDVVFDTFLGAASVDGREQFNAAGIELTRQMGKLNPADIFNLPNWTRPLLGMTARRPADDLHSLVAELLTDEELAGEQSGQLQLLRMLASATDPETGTAMTPVRLRENIVGALAAGRETTALALAWTLWLVAQHRPTRERLAAEAAALSADDELTGEALRSSPFSLQVIREAMRLYPPAPQIARTAAEAVSLAGHELRKGDQVVIAAYALHRREDYWPNPHAFDPERFGPGRYNARASRLRYLPFGGGPRICLGMAFAIVELQAMLLTLMRMGTPALRPGHDRVEFEVGATLRPGNGLFVALDEL
jgi:cytochrome P450